MHQSKPEQYSSSFSNPPEILVVFDELQKITHHRTWRTPTQRSTNVQPEMAISRLTIILFSIFTYISAGPGIGPTMNCTWYQGPGKQQANHIIYQYSSGIEGGV
jgi:hypothetical protein